MGFFSLYFRPTPYKIAFLENFFKFFWKILSTPYQINFYFIKYLLLLFCFFASFQLEMCFLLLKIFILMCHGQVFVALKNCSPWAEWIVFANQFSYYCIILCCVWFDFSVFRKQFLMSKNSKKCSEVGTHNQFSKCCICTRSTFFKLFILSTLLLSFFTYQI